VSNRLVIDIATCALDGAAEWLPDVRAAKNLKDPAKIEADLADKRAEQQEKLGLDLDLCRISAIGWCDVTGWEPGEVQVALAETVISEANLLGNLHKMLKHSDTITFNGLSFDLPLIERRLLYCGLPPLGWNLDRYRSPHVDLLAKLSNHGQRPYRPLSFYIKRLGWTDLSKPLSGADEALAPSRGQWVELEASVRHDVIATLRLAQWMRVIQPAAVTA
jgi:hypothetical protein